MAPALVAERLPAPDVPISGLRLGRCHAEGDERAIARGLGGDLDGVVESFEVGDDVIGRQDEKQGISVVAAQHERGGGRRVPAVGLQDDGRGCYADLPKLLGHDEAVLVVAHDERRGEAFGVGDAARGFLQQGVVGNERQELLGIERPRERPQARSHAAGEDDGVDRIQ